jgi:hypothetical protein
VTTTDTVASHDVRPAVKLVPRQVHRVTGEYVPIVHMARERVRDDGPAHEGPAAQILNDEGRRATLSTCWVAIIPVVDPSGVSLPRERQGRDEARYVNLRSTAHMRIQAWFAGLESDRRTWRFEDSTDSPLVTPYWPYVVERPETRSTTGANASIALSGAIQYVKPARTGLFDRVTDLVDGPGQRERYSSASSSETPNASPKPRAIGTRSVVAATNTRVEGRRPTHRHAMQPER